MVCRRLLPATTALRERLLQGLEPTTRRHHQPSHMAAAAEAPRGQGGHDVAVATTIIAAGRPQAWVWRIDPGLSDRDADSAARLNVVPDR